MVRTRPWRIGTALLIFTATDLFAVSLLYALGLDVTVMLSLMPGVSICALVSALLWVRRDLWTVAVLSVCIPACFAVAGHYADQSYDGPWYHAAGVRAVQSGWNPYYDPPLTAVRPVVEPSPGAVWVVNHFPKGAWFLSGTIGAVTGNLESGKGFHLLLALAAFLLCVDFLRSWLLAFLAAANPIVLTQWASHYLDGQIASLLTIALVLAGQRAFFLAGMALGILSTYKVPALGYAGVLAVGIGLLYRVRAAWTPLVLVVASIGGIGFNPYVTNWVRTGNPIYPVGSDSSFMPPENQPLGFPEMNRVSKLVTSLFSRSGSPTAPDSPQLKWPWQIARDETQCFKVPDCRIGGFGPYFAAILLLSGLLTALVWRRSASEDRRSFAIFGSIVIGTVLLHPESWWARYVPQLWLLPIAALVFSFRTRQPRVIRGVTWFLLLVIAYDCKKVAQTYLHVQAPLQNPTALR